MPGVKERRKAGQNTVQQCPVFGPEKELEWKDFWERLTAHLQEPSARYRHLLPLLKYLLQCDGMDVRDGTPVRAESHIAAWEYAWISKFFRSESRHILEDLEVMNEKAFFKLGASTKWLKDNMRLAASDAYGASTEKDKRSDSKYKKGDIVLRTSLEGRKKKKYFFVLTVLTDADHVKHFPLTHSEDGGLMLSHTNGTPLTHKPGDNETYLSLPEFLDALVKDSERARVQYRDERGRVCTYSCKAGGGKEIPTEPSPPSPQPTFQTISGLTTSSTTKASEATLESLGCSKQDRYYLRDVNGEEVVVVSGTQLLGKGSFGSVVRADEVKGTKLIARALKIASTQQNDEETDLQLRELEIMKKMEHPHCVKMYGCGEDKRGHERRLLICMELMECSLDKLIKEAEKPIMSPEHGYQILSGLHYLHEKKIAHRDLKPGNVLCTKHPDASYHILKLSDFGQSKAYGRGDQTATLTHTGTLMYNSPERLEQMASGAQHGVDWWSLSDVWSAGCTMLQMHTLRLPYEWPRESPALSQFAFIQRRRAKPGIAEDTYPLEIDIPSDIPSDLGKVLKASLETDPRERKSAGALLELPYFQTCAAGLDA